MTELLIIKEGDAYFRFKDDGFERCAMSRGTVFPLSRLEDAKAACATLKKEDVAGRLMKLTIVEEPYTEISAPE
jgi:hypothetical protein